MSLTAADRSSRCCRHRRFRWRSARGSLAALMNANTLRVVASLHRPASPCPVGSALKMRLLFPAGFPYLSCSCYFGYRVGPCLLPHLSPPPSPISPCSLYTVYYASFCLRRCTSGDRVPRVTTHKSVSLFYTAIEVSSFVPNFCSLVFEEPH